MAEALPRIAIVGAGLLGRLLAFQLRADAQITLFDQDSGAAEQSAAYLAAAMLAPLAESAESSHGIMALGEESLKLWPKILQQLHEPVFFQQQGSLLVAFEQDRACLTQLQRNLKGDNYQRVDKAQIHALEPEINSRFQQGLFLPDEGQLDNRELLRVLATSLRKYASIDWHCHAKAEIQAQRLVVNGKVLQGFDWIVDCRGLGAKAQQSDLRGVRGEVLRLYAPQVTLQRPLRLMHPRYPLYIAPKANHHFVVGATQLESEDARQPTVRSTLELLSACFSVHSGFAEAEIQYNQSGLRPAYVDNEPQMRVSGKVISLNGLYRHGYLLSPVMVDLCRNYLLGNRLNPLYLQQIPTILQESAPEILEFA
ncbi:glycine oxidase ThiO [Thiosulfatimonas sediminis]|uniref:D-amino-acid oxidase n=1 Tax=Thiosulfatimonas sediminis TaxID=2675054 RepID=A0A6F8PUY8_9GAMM|nr:FAD-dependent oxidoreductase [Thiosulfatimonas sediminis]BBP45847.1 glycine oxidase ThiO [Thiosulfatimonas sediminis]